MKERKKTQKRSANSTIQRQLTKTYVNMLARRTSMISLILFSTNLLLLLFSELIAVHVFFVALRELILIRFHSLRARSGRSVQSTVLREIEGTFLEQQSNCHKISGEILSQFSECNVRVFVKILLHRRVIQRLRATARGEKKRVLRASSQARLCSCEYIASRY